jgi:hypothetical protein
LDGHEAPTGVQQGPPAAMLRTMPLR